MASSCWGLQGAYTQSGPSGGRSIALNWSPVWKLIVDCGGSDQAEGRAGVDSPPPSRVHAAAAAWLRSKLKCGRSTKYSPPSGRDVYVFFCFGIRLCESSILGSAVRSFNCSMDPPLDMLANELWIIYHYIKNLRPPCSSMLPHYSHTLDPTLSHPTRVRRDFDIAESSA